MIQSLTRANEALDLWGARAEMALPEGFVPIGDGLPELGADHQQLIEKRGDNVSVIAWRPAPKPADAPSAPDRAQYAWSFDGEGYTGTCESIAEALTEGLTERYVGHPLGQIHVGMIEAPSIDFEGLACTLFDDVGEQLADQCGEFADNWTPTKDHHRRLAAVLKQWFNAEKGLEFGCYSVENAQAFDAGHPDYDSALVLAKARWRALEARMQAEAPK